MCVECHWGNQHHFVTAKTSKHWALSRYQRAQANIQYHRDHSVGYAAEAERLEVNFALNEVRTNTCAYVCMPLHQHFDKTISHYNNVGVDNPFVQVMCRSKPKSLPLT